MIWIDAADAVVDFQVVARGGQSRIGAQELDHQAGRGAALQTHSAEGVEVGQTISS